MYYKLYTEIFRFLFFHFTFRDFIREYIAPGLKTIKREPYISKTITKTCGTRLLTEFWSDVVQPLRKSWKRWKESLRQIPKLHKQNVILKFIVTTCQMSILSSWNLLMRETQCHLHLIIHLVKEDKKRSQLNTTSNQRLTLLTTNMKNPLYRGKHA